MLRRHVAFLLASAIVLAACGGSDGEAPTTTSAPAPSTTAAPSAEERARATSMLLNAGDVTLAADTANAARTDKTPPEITTFTGTADVDNQRLECGIAVFQPGQDRLDVIGDHLLVSDPIDGKKLYVNSQVILKQDQAAAESSVAHLRDPATIGCVLAYFGRQLETQRRRPGSEGLQANLTVEPLVLAGLGSRTAALRFHETAHLPGNPALDQYIDVIMTYVSNAEITLVVESSLRPPAVEFDRALVERARAKAVRIAG